MGCICVCTSVTVLHTCVCMYRIHVCVHVCACAGAPTGVCMWRPEVYIGYLALLLSTLSFEQGVSPNLKSVDWLTWLASDTLDPSLSTFPVVGGVTGTHWWTQPFIYGCCESALKSSCLSSKHFAHRSIIQSPIVLFINRMSWCLIESYNN